MTHPRIIFAPDEGGGSAVAEVQADTSAQGQPSTEAAQVQAADDSVAQGQAGTSLYDEALSSVPEEHRPYVEGHFKEWDRKVNAKLSEAAEYRKVWEPFEQLGIGSDDLGLEQVEALVELGRALTDPKSREQTVLELAEAFGISLQPEPSETPVSSIPELDALAAQVEELRQARDHDVQVSAEAQAEAQLQAEYGQILERHGREFTDREMEKLGRLVEAFAHVSDTPLIDAYDVLSESIGDAEEQLIQQAAGQPKAAVPGTGRAATGPTPVTSFDEAERLLRERNKASA